MLTLFRSEAAAAANAGNITEFSVPTAGSDPSGMLTGVALASLTPHAANAATAGTITEFPIPTQESVSLDIVQGADGVFWFTESGANQIGRITPSGVVSGFPTPNPTARFVTVVYPDGRTEVSISRRSSMAASLPYHRSIHFPPE